MNTCFTPLHDMSKVLLRGDDKGEVKVLHSLSGIYMHYDYNTGHEESIVNFSEVKCTNYSVIRKPHSVPPLSTNVLPTTASLLKLETGKVVLFIPYTKLIVINYDGCDDSS